MIKYLLKAGLKSFNANAHDVLGQPLLNQAIRFEDRDCINAFLRFGHRGCINAFLPKKKMGLLQGMAIYFSWFLILENLSIERFSLFDSKTVHNNSLDYETVFSQELSAGRNRNFEI